jgi:hypothetical protein
MGASFRTKVGGLNRDCCYELAAVSGRVVKPAQPTQAAPAVSKPTLAAMPAKKTSTGTTNADKVRGYIRAAKERGFGPEFVIEMAVSHLGMNRQLAKAYTKNNWDKA